MRKSTRAAIAAVMAAPAARFRPSLAVLAGVVLLSGCAASRSPAGPPADNTADICAQWTASTKPFLSRGADAAPEAKAYQKAMVDAYAGKEMPSEKAQAIQRAYWSAQEKAPRALAAEATSARLRAALIAYADELAGRGTDVVPEFVGSTSPVLQALITICAPSPAA
jgi:hypothetical protein